MFSTYQTVTMKKILPFLLTLFAIPTFAQEGAQLYNNDAIDLRGMPLAPNPQWAPFFHGVASGDPLADRVIIWTRITPETIEPNLKVEVDWLVASDPAMENILRSGTVTTDNSRDFTVKVDVTGLSAGTTYYYMFRAMERNSLVGKTKTTPTGDQARHLKFGVVSCSNLPAGFFNAYERLAERTDLDAIIHLGDYIYEYGNGFYGDSTLVDRRVAPPHEIISLAEYRIRYSSYRLDTNLIRVHQQHPFIVVWDDHESANDAYRDGAQNHDEATEGPWSERKMAAKQAYFEWLPIRNTPQREVFRKISYGNLVDLIMLDTRLTGREKQILDFFAPELQDTSRTILGTIQKQWLLETLRESKTKWKIIGQQVVFSELNVGWAGLVEDSLSFSEWEGIAQDIWDGYPAERNQIMAFIQEKSIDNIVILTGDFHTAFAFDVTPKPVSLSFSEFPLVGEAPVYRPSDSYDAATGRGSIGVEFVTASVTSANFDENLGSALALVAQEQINRELSVFGLVNLGNPNPHMKYANLIEHGYFILDVKPDSVQANWYFSPIREVSTTERFAQAWYTLDQENHLVRADAESAPKTVQDIPAPAEPIDSPTSSVEQRVGPPLTVFNSYPNPFSNSNTLHYGLNAPQELTIDLIDQNGRLVKHLTNQYFSTGLYSLILNGNSYPQGVYYYRIQGNGFQKTVKIILEK